MKLSTRFCSAAVQRSDPGVMGLRCQGQSSPPGGGALRVRQGDVELPDVEVRSICSVPPCSLKFAPLRTRAHDGEEGRE